MRRRLIIVVIFIYMFIAYGSDHTFQAPAKRNQQWNKGRYFEEEKSFVRQTMHNVFSAFLFIVSSAWICANEISVLSANFDFTGTGVKKIPTLLIERISCRDLETKLTKLYIQNDREFVRGCKRGQFSNLGGCKKYNRYLFCTDIFSVEKQKCWVFPSSQPLVQLFKAIDNNRNVASLMNFEWARYASFKSFPMESPAMPSRLAASGFFYTEKEDIVMCFSCNLKYGGWKYEDDPTEIHIRLSPNCAFMNKTDSINIPIHSSNETTMQGATGGFETDGIQRSAEIQIQQQSRQESRHSINNTGRIQYKFPEYTDIVRRRDSFTGWHSSNVSPEDLTHAGFFYAGIGDCVRCFSCGGGLRNWEYGDTPWEEHARWFSSCRYLNEQKTSEFIRQCQNPSPAREIVDQTSDDQDSWKSAQEVITQDALNDNTPLETHETKPRMKITHDQKTKPNLKINLTNTKETSHADDEHKSLIEKLLPMGFSLERIHSCISRMINTDATVDFVAVLDSLLNLSDEPDSPLTDAVEKDGVTRESLISNQSYLPSATAPKLKESLQLEKENTMLKDQLACKICMDKYSNVVFTPCGHMVSCDSCSRRLRKCALCRQLINGRIRVCKAS